jgi:hypothetical protein
MLPPILEHLAGGRRSSLDDYSEDCAQPTTAPKKSVRFSADAARDGEIAAHSTKPAAHAASGNRGISGGRDLAATAVGFIDHGDAASRADGANLSTADAFKKVSEAATKAERHYWLLPTWRVKLPVVQW